MLKQTRPRAWQAGVTLIEVLVTILILAFGLLGLAAFQLKAQSAEMESYQRAQALILVQDMAERIGATAANATDPGTAAGTYVSDSTLGTGDGEPASCGTLAMGAVRDRCEWSNALKGAAEQQGGNKVGAMIGAVGCIEQTQAENTAAGVCTPASLRVTVAWQGLNPTLAPSLTCGQGLFGSENQRRAVAAQVTLGLPSCI